MISLDFPWVLLLLPLPYFVYRFMPPAKRQTQAIIAPFFTRAEPLATDQPLAGNKLIDKLLLAILWLLLLLACARPMWIGESQGIPSSGRDLLVAVDISESMETEDMLLANQQVPRVTAVKRVVSDFISRRHSDRIGLVLFGSQAYLQAPLTFDQQTVARFLEEARLGFAGNKTAIGDAIGLAIKRLQQRPENNRILILLTDGANNTGEIAPLQAAKLAQQAGVKIYTVGLGANEMIIRSFFGNQRINPSADLDEEVLKEIAQVTGGQYFRAIDTQQLETIYRELDTLEPIQQEQLFRPRQSLFMWPLGLALCLSFLFWLMRFYSVKNLAGLFTSKSKTPKEAIGD